MVERYVYTNIQKIESPALRSAVNGIARLVLDNWLYVLALLALWRFPYWVASLTGSEVTPLRPSGDSFFWQSVMAQALLIACLSMSYNLLFGFSGVISFGHALFFGMGGYATFLLMSQYDGSARVKGLVIGNLVLLGLAAIVRLPLRRLLIALVALNALLIVLLPGGESISLYRAAGVAILISVTLSLLSGVVTLRLKGVYFTMFTLALAQMFWVLAKSGTFREITGAEDGLPVRGLIPEALNPTQRPTGDPLTNRLTMYKITIVFFVLVFLAIRRYLSSPVGRVMLAIRENEERARTIGYNTFYYKLLTMTFAGVIASLSGILFVLWGANKKIDPELLSLKYTVNPLLYTLIGGVGTLVGPVISSLGLELTRVYLDKKTFTLGTELVGPITLWHVLVLAVLGLVLWVLRRPGNRWVERLWRWRHPGQEPGREVPTYRRFRLVAAALAGIVLAALTLWTAAQVYESEKLGETVYFVSDLWPLFLGFVFIAVVMLLPNGIVGTWNRWWIERRLRRMEKELQKGK